MKFLSGSLMTIPASALTVPQAATLLARGGARTDRLVILALLWAPEAKATSGVRVG